jgi:hypothetical protein
LRRNALTATSATIPMANNDCAEGSGTALKVNTVPATAPVLNPAFALDTAVSDKVVFAAIALSSK